MAYVIYLSANLVEIDGVVLFTALPTYIHKDGFRKKTIIENYFCAQGTQKRIFPQNFKFDIKRSLYHSRPICDKSKHLD